MKKMICALAALLAAMLLCSCGNKKPSEKTLEQDIQAYVSQSYPGYTVSNMKIEKSKTESKGYYAEVSFEVKKAFVGGKSTADLYYGKYDGGKWGLESTSICEPSFKMMELPSEKELISGIDGFLDPIEKAIYAQRLFFDSTIKDIKVNNVEKDGEKVVCADISWSDEYEGCISKLHGVAKIEFGDRNTLWEKVTNAGQDKLDFSHLVGKKASNGYYNYTIEECTTDRIVFRDDNGRYVYVRDYEYESERYARNMGRVTELYYQIDKSNPEPWHNYWTSITSFTLKTRNVESYSDHFAFISYGTLSSILSIS